MSPSQPKAALMNLVSRHTKYWEQCWNPKVCVPIPFDGEQCVGASICVRIVEDGGAFYLEAELNGSAIRYELANACIPAFSIGIATLEACVTNLDIQNGQLKGLHLTVKLCIGADIGPIHVGKCWDLFGQDIVFSHLSAKDVSDILRVKVDHRSAEWAGRTFVVSNVAKDSTSRDSACRCC